MQNVEPGEHEKPQRTPPLVRTTTNLKKSQDQWEPLSVALRRVMARMFVDQKGEPHGKSDVP